MEDRRLKLRRHIQAARAWLQQADKSLERENDVQGDLKVMLAKAELEQMHSSRRLWLRRCLPPLTALSIAAMIFFADGSTGDPADASREQAPPLTVATESKDSEVSLSDQTPTVQPDAVVEVPRASEYELESASPIEEYYAESVVDESSGDDLLESEPPVIESMEYESAFEEYSEPESYDRYEAFVPPSTEEYERVPTEDLQQLMLDAGQILRAK